MFVIRKMKNNVFNLYQISTRSKISKKKLYKNILWILCDPSYSETLKCFREVVMCPSLTALQDPKESLSGMRFITLSHGLGREQMTFQPPFL